MRTFHIARLALDGVRRRPVRTGLTVVGVAIAAGALVCMFAHALGLQEKAESAFDELGLVHLVEIRGPNEEVDGEPPVLDDALLEHFETFPEVELAYPHFRLRGVEVRRGDLEKNAMVLGLPPELGLIGLTRDLIVAGAFLSDARASEALLATKLAADLGFESPADAVGQAITLESSGMLRGEDGSVQFSTESLEVTVVGVFEPPTIAMGIGASALLLPVELTKRLPGALLTTTIERLRHGGDPGAAGYSRAMVKVRQPRDAITVARRIEEEFGFETRAFLAELDEMRQYFLFLDALVIAIGSIAVLVAGLGIVNTQLTAVLERVREIGVYKAIGATDGDVRTVFLVEAATVGLIGSVVGLALARLAAWGIEWFVVGLARRAELSAEFTVFSFSPGLLLAAVVFTVAISVLAGVIPAARAARVDPIRALRGE